MRADIAIPTRLGIFGMIAWTIELATRLGALLLLQLVDYGWHFCKTRYLLSTFLRYSIASLRDVSSKSDLVLILKKGEGISYPTAPILTLSILF